MGRTHKHSFDYSGTCVRNLYRFILQRECDEGGFNCYRNHPFEFVLETFLKSDEYKNLQENKKYCNQLQQTINYVILKINDRAKESNKILHNTLNSNFIYNDIKCINYKETDVELFFRERQIDIRWMADLFGLSPETSMSELAVTASHIVAMEYLIENDLEQILVFEDDVVLDNNFLSIFSQCFNDLPKDYDFLSDNTLFPNYEELSTEEFNFQIESQFICRAHLQNAHTGFMLYSKKGAKKILELYKKYGIICSIDTFLFWLNRRDELQGYTTYHSNKLLYTKDIFGSMVLNARTL